MSRPVHYGGVTEPAASTPAAQTVLVVEDEVFIRMVIADYLRGCGYKVLEAANADEAVLLLAHVEIAVDVVFSDIDMPGSMDGFALSTWVHANRPGLDVILTGSVPRSVNAAAELCDSGPLPKPYEPSMAADRIRRLMGARASKKE
jgi:CheY-like chemotaxis protein